MRINDSNINIVTDGTLNGITTATIGGSTYALVTAFDDDGVQIINITDPYNPINASSITNSTSYPTLNGANSIITATIGGSTYALVTAFDDDGVQIINIDDPYNPTNASSITDGTRYPTLNGASSITTVIIGGFTYALVASTYNSGVQIIRLSSPPLSMDKVSPTMSVTCTLKFAYSSLCVDGTITVDLKSRPSMIVVAFNPDSRIETLLEASVLFTVNSMLRLSPAFAYTGFGLLVIIERGGEDNLMIWTPLL